MSSVDRDPDVFYNVLKSRVSHRLLELGIHPENDRCATWGRCAYYVTTLIMLIVAGYYHVKAHLLGSFFFAVLCTSI